MTLIGFVDKITVKPCKTWVMWKEKKNEKGMSSQQTPCLLGMSHMSVVNLAAESLSTIMDD